MTTADTAPEQSGASGTAPGAELSIPKYRLDEVSAELKRAREELVIKDRLITETQQRMLQPQQTRGSDIPSAEESGLDANTYQAIVKLAERIADRKLAPEKAVFEQQIGLLAQRTEKAELLAAKGADKERYLPEIQRRQQEHFRNTGGFLPAEMALKLIQADEMEKRIRELEARNGAQSQTTTPAQTTQTTAVPNAAATRQIPGGAPGAGSGGTTQRSFGELNVEEMEARLQEEFGRGTTL